MLTQVLQAPGATLLDVCPMLLLLVVCCAQWAWNNSSDLLGTALTQLTLPAQMARTQTHVFTNNNATILECAGAVSGKLVRPQLALWHWAQPFYFFTICAASTGFYTILPGMDPRGALLCVI